MTNGTFILLGSNLGDKGQNLVVARKQIEAIIGKVTTHSSLYQTAAWGKENQPVFYNQVLAVDTRLNAENLLAALLSIEKNMGRERKEKWGERLIDLDILYFNNEIIDSQNLKVPHPGITERRFTLIPLVEIAPNFAHPLSGKTNTQLLNDCKDFLEVVKVIPYRTL